MEHGIPEAEALVDSTLTMGDIGFVLGCLMEKSEELAN